MAGYRLTEEGKGYLENGLPERNLVELLNKIPRRSLEFNKALVRVKNFPVALKWCLENGWVSRTENELFLKKYPEKMPIEEALRKISQHEEIDEQSLGILIQRKLVDKITTVQEEARKFIGKEINELTPEIIKTGVWKEVKFRPYNVQAVGKVIQPGKRQPYNQFLSQVRQKLVELGFKQMIGPTIETEFWNFDALYQPQNHPARDWASTYQLKYPKFGMLPEKEIVEKVKTTHENGWRTGSIGWGYKWSHEKASQLMPRAHDTAISPRYMAKGVEIPGKYFNMVRCYRPDVIDVTHGVEFIQTGGFVVDKDLNFRHLLGLLKMFVHEISGIKETKFFTDYYPFTEPSVQISGKHPKLGWIELAGAGIFRPELTEPLGIKETVIAWGFGIDRLAMYKLNLNDIRDLFSRNLEWLRDQKVIM